MELMITDAERVIGAIMVTLLAIPCFIYIWRHDKKNR